MSRESETIIIEQNLTIRFKHHVIELTLEEAHDLKDELIKAVGAQTPKHLRPIVVQAKSAEEAVQRVGSHLA